MKTNVALALAGVAWATGHVEAGEYAGCGVLVQGVECVLFQADVGLLFFLENLGSFGVGDYVFVQGQLEGCATICLQEQACILENTIALCPLALKDCGELVQGVECILFQRDIGGTYLLDDLGGFGVGARVLVIGTIDPRCVNTCLEGDGCVEVDAIDFCCLGDANVDFAVNVGDLLVVVSDWGCTDGGQCPGDVNFDGVVDVGDLVDVVVHWGPCALP
jgi:hypothetical protein